MFFLTMSPSQSLRFGTGQQSRLSALRLTYTLLNKYLLANCLPNSQTVSHTGQDAQRQGGGLAVLSQLLGPLGKEQLG